MIDCSECVPPSKNDAVARRNFFFSYNLFYAKRMLAEELENNDVKDILTESLDWLTPLRRDATWTIDFLEYYYKS